MTRVQVLQNAENDLDALWVSDPDNAAAIAVMLDEIEGNSAVADTLIQRGYRRLADPSYEIKRFGEFWKVGETVYILKFWEVDGTLIPYRIIYAHHPQLDIAYVLAVMPRDVDYATNHPLIIRIRADYGRLSIPTY